MRLNAQLCNYIWRSGRSGALSQAVRANGFIFASGHIPLDPVTQEMVRGGIYARFFNSDPPARTMTGAAALPKGALIEIEVTAIDK